MKINKDFVVKEMNDGNGKKTHYAIAIGKTAAKFKGMIKLNDTAYEVWRFVEQGLSEDEIIERLFDEYDAGKGVIEENVRSTIETFRSVNAVID